MSSTHKPRRRSAGILVAAGAVLALTAACQSGTGKPVANADGSGSSAAGGTSARSSGGTSNSTQDLSANAEPGEVEAENIIATCMKQRGFTYVPRPQQKETPDQERMRRYTGPASLLLSDAELRQYRQKYGFGQYYAPFVYPNDPLVSEQFAPNPNNQIVAALDPARRHAYNVALDGGARSSGKSGSTTSAAYKTSCQNKAQAIRDKFAKSEQKVYDAKKRDYDKVIARFQNDPDVQKAARKYLGCLADKGLKPQSYSYTYIGNAGSDGFAEIPPNSDVPTTAQARQRLPKEITAALDDLACRSSLAKLVRTKFPNEPAAALGGGGDGVG